MRRVLVIVGLALTFAIVSAPHAAAQTCSGLPSIGLNSKGNVGASLAIASGSVGVGANVTYGTTHAFGTFEIGKTNYTEFEYTSTVVAFTLGGQFAVGKSRPLAICPVANASADWAGDLNQFGLSITNDVITGGANVGLVMGGDRRQVVPMFGLSAGQLRFTQAVPGTRITDKETIALVTLGVGFVFDQRIALRPAISRPFGFDGATTTFSFIATVAFGHR